MLRELGLSVLLALGGLASLAMAMVLAFWFSQLIVWLLISLGLGP